MYFIMIQNMAKMFKFNNYYSLLFDLRQKTTSTRFITFNAVRKSKIIL